MQPSHTILILARTPNLTAALGRLVGAAVQTTAQFDHAVALITGHRRPHTLYIEDVWCESVPALWAIVRVATSQRVRVLVNCQGQACKQADGLARAGAVIVHGADPATITAQVAHALGVRVRPTPPAAQAAALAPPPAHAD